MVKFGGHVEAIRKGDLEDANLYLVPYNKMKKVINEGDESKAAEEKTEEETVFIDSWKQALKTADEDFGRARGEIWTTVFEEVAASDDGADPIIRGAHPGSAIQFYVDLKHDKEGDIEAQELLSKMKLVFRAASINSEALRKLVKKHDKHNKANQLSSMLLPKLYTSPLYSGQNMLQESIDLLRELLEGDEFEGITTEDEADIDMDTLIASHNDQPFKAITRRDSDAVHREARDLRMNEFNWLKSLVRSIPAQELLPRLVSHRGFHNTKDRNDKRPVENSLDAYETAWSCGIELCECDIALTKDEKLVLAHDEDFARLSLDSESANSKKKVSDLTFREIMSMPLLSGARPPLLIDVLRSASAISDKAKLVIEIKPGNQASAFALARLLVRHPDLRGSVAMIMSFDASSMHHLKAELDRSMPLEEEGDVGPRMHRRLSSYDHFGRRSSAWLGGMGPSSRQLSSRHLGSTRNLGGSTRQLGTSPKLGSNRQLSPNLGPGRASIGLNISDLNLQSIDEPGSQNKMHGSVSFDGYYHQAQESPPRNMPKLMLLTVADPPNIPCELQVKHNELHRVDNWLAHDGASLDGVYLQYEKEMKTPEGAAHLRELSQRFMVGVWGYANKDPDDYETFSVRTSLSQSA